MSIHRHDLRPPRFRSTLLQTCAICASRAPTTIAIRTCVGCGAFVCAECVARHKSQAGFVIHLRQNANKTLLPYYLKYPETTQVLSRSLEAAFIYHEFQKYFLTDEYIKDLGVEIESNEKELRALTAQTKKVRDTLLAYRIELLAAQQQTRRH